MQAFLAHYLRLNAARMVADKVEALITNIQPGDVKSQPTHKVDFHLPSLGFNHMVTPIKKPAHPKHSNVFGGDLSKTLQNLSWDFDAQTKVAPNLCAVISGSWMTNKSMLRPSKVSWNKIKAWADMNPALENCGS